MKAPLQEVPFSPAASAAAFAAFAAARDISLARAAPAQGLACMLDFFMRVRAIGCDGDDADMLLFQWGMYDWMDGAGRHFELDLTRQFIEDSKGDDDAISQLRLVYHFPPTPTLETLPEGNRWCGAPADLPAFRDYVLATPAYAALAQRIDGRVRVEYGYV